MQRLQILYYFYVLRFKLTRFNVMGDRVVQRPGGMHINAFLVYTEHKKHCEQNIARNIAAVSPVVVPNF